MIGKGTLKAIQAAQRRRERDAQKRLRELERQAKEQAKLSAIEQARLEVETYEGGLEVLLSVHKEQGAIWDWMKLATALPPHSPRKFFHHELKARQRPSDQMVAAAAARDESEFQEALHSHAQEMAEWERMKAIARRILAREHGAYTEALTEFSGLAEISNLGSSLHFTVHTDRLVECRLKVNGQQVIPGEVKTLTSAGKVSVKPMPKSRFHELYQDYVCGCLLRAAREMFALLPIETALITASADVLDSRTGQMIEQPVLSVAFPRATFERLDFDHIDPSDAMENFCHRGDAKASRKSGEFAWITPLTLADLPQNSCGEVDYRDLFEAARRARNEIVAAMETMRPQSESPQPTATQSL